MPSLFVEDFSCQLAKHGHRHSGDIIKISRNPHGTLALLADGMGSGISAMVDATVTCEYLTGLIEGGTPAAGAMRASLRSLRKARISGGPWAALNMVHISPDGQAELFCYESPVPLLVTAGGLEEPVIWPEYVEGEIVQRASIHLRAGETILMFSDGVTQAGLGRGLPRGWGIDGVSKFLKAEGLDRRGQAQKLPAALVHQANALNHNRAADDISVLALVLRRPRVLNILTGPPLRQSDTTSVMKSFMEADGLKAVCGGTTSRLLASFIGITPVVHAGEMGCPAHYDIEGIDLATEGTVTLNRLNNIFLDPELAHEAGYGPSRLLELVSGSDEIRFWVGQAQNPAHHQSLKPAGLLSRNEVITALAEKMRQAGKFVSIKRY